MEGSTHLTRKNAIIGDPRIPSGGGPKPNGAPHVPIGARLIAEISRLDPEVNIDALNDPEWQMKIFEVVTWYLKHIGVNPTLVQTGIIANEDGSEMDKNYFFAGNYLLKKGDEIIYEDLDDPSGLFQVLITGKNPQLP